MKRTVLVVGATGKQGQAFIKALLRTATPSSETAIATEETDWHVLALTRDQNSPRARALLNLNSKNPSHDRITLVEGDLVNKASIRKIFEENAPIWGVFVVFAYPGMGAKSSPELEQGKMLAELALEIRVEGPFVYSSSMSAAETSLSVPDISHDSKRDVEAYCREMSTKGLNWTIIRPGFFMENLDGFMGSIGVTILREGLKKDTTITLVASEDIGKVAAGVFKNHPRYLHKTLSISSGAVTMDEIASAHERATGKPIPTVPTVLGKFLLKANTGCQTLVRQIERSHEARMKGEYGSLESEIELARSACPDRLQDYEAWKRAQVASSQIASSSPQQSSELQNKNWNKLSLSKLLTGRS